LYFLLFYQRSLSHVWLPRSIAQNDPNVVVARVSKDGLIHQVWVNESFAGRPIQRDRIPGLHVSDILAPAESERMLAYIEAHLSRNIPVCDTVTLSLPVRHKHRKVRILPLDNNEVLPIW